MAPKGAMFFSKSILPISSRTLTLEQHILKNNHPHLPDMPSLTHLREALNRNDLFQAIHGIEFAFTIVVMDSDKGANS